MPKVHKFEDGFVERSVAIVVRDKTAYVEYSIGLNETTVRDLLTQWEQASAPTAEQSKSAGSQEQPRSETEALRDQHKSIPIDPANTSSGSATGQTKESSTTKVAQELTQRQSDTRRKSTPESRSEADDSTEGHSIEPLLLANFKKVATDQVARGLKIKCNGKPLTVTSIAAGPPPRHPFIMTIQFKVQLPDSEICELKINDENFGKQHGAVRYALKAAGRAMLLKSDVAPILVRAERIELSKTPITQRASLTSINARLGFAPSPKK